jgi:iron complex outermembrane receptor protein
LKNLELHTHLSFYSKQEEYHLEAKSYSTYIQLATYYATLYEQYMVNPTTEIEQDLKIIGQRLSVIGEEITVQKDYPARLLVNLGARYTINNLELTFDIHNLFNHKYSQSGMSTGLIPQKGLWFMGTIGYKF